MPFLIAVSFVWAFSFGLTKGKLAGLDSAFISAARLGLAVVVFLPFLRVRGIAPGVALRLIAIGAIQFGAMYLALNESYRHLAAHEIVLFTLTTPLFVTLLADALNRSFNLRALAVALLAIAGAVLATAKKDFALNGALTGVALVQISNLTFAIGQVAYRRMREKNPTLRDRDIFGLLYAGAFALTLPVAIARGGAGFPVLTSTQLYTLLYLGVLASGLCFFLWNVGATRVDTSTLAVFNNVKIPLGVACSLIFFDETADLPRLIIGGSLVIAAVIAAETYANKRPTDTKP